MKVKLSATHEGRCSICGNETIVFNAGDEESRRVVAICRDCSQKLEMTIEEAIEKYGMVNEAAFKEGMRIEPGTVAG